MKRVLLKKQLMRMKTLKWARQIRKFKNNRYPQK